MVNINLRDLRVGEQGKVMGFQDGNRMYRKRLLAMGLTRGTTFQITRYAPMGDPVEIKLRGFALTLRKREADALLIEKVNA